MEEVILPTLRGMAADGIPYIGFLYAGLMVAPDGSIKVLEFNCRFGDPETQPIMMRLKSDFPALCLKAVDGKLDECDTEWDPRPALGVVMAAGGYPGDYAKGDVIEGLPEQESADLKVFHAGTAINQGRAVTAGGRVLCVSALGTTVSEAQKKAYEQVKRIKWPGAFYRIDIGHRATTRG
jgi:phosphoribosylamine--glycine ligase